jgi:hypothetical protein
LIPATSFPESAPFLLVRPSDRDVTEVLEEDEEEPAAKSVPPRPPPSAVTTTEHSLPSVIVDLHELEESAEEEASRASDVDGLLQDIETHANLRDSRRVQTLHVIDEPRRERGSLRNLTLALLTAFVVAGTTFAGLRASHVLPSSLGAAIHSMR